MRYLYSMKTRFRHVVLCMAMLCAIQAYAQSPYIPYRTHAPFTLDGQMTEPDWQYAAEEDQFIQQGPVPGAPATERTTFRVMYDNDYLYVGIRAYDQQPDQLIRAELQRDFPLGNDDGTGVTIDTYLDKFTGMCFVSNTLNARWDAQVTMDGDGQATSFNTFWDARTTVNDSGYVTEYRIPFSTLRFQSAEQVTMGIRIARLIKRKNELITYPPLDSTLQNMWVNVSNAREIVFTGLQGGKAFYVSPYAIANYSAANLLNAAGTGYSYTDVIMNRKQFVSNETLDKVLSNVGLDVKYGLSKNMTLDLTLNTDFAQAEVDDRIINLTKYEVNLPEKRQFFLESANALSFGFPSGNTLFITRKIGNEQGFIVPIIGGARLTGKSNGWLTGALNMQTLGVVTDEDTIAAHNFSVVRTRKDIDTLGSFVGGIICNRLDTDGSGNSFQSYGLDFVKRITQQLVIEGGVAATGENASFKGIDSSYYAHIGVFKNAREGLTYSAMVDAIGSGMNPVMGYLDEQDYGNTNGSLTYQWAISKIPALQYIYVYTDANYRWKLASGDQETLQNGVGAGFYFKNGASIECTVLERKEDSLFFDWALDEQNAISAGNYTMYNTFLGITLPTQSTYNISFGGSYGGFFGGLRANANTYIQYYVNAHFNFSLEYDFNHIAFDRYLNIDSSTQYVSNLIRLGLNYNFTTKLSLKAYIQYEDLSDLTSANLRFRYNPTEGTDLYIVINEGVNANRNRLDPQLPYVANQAVTVKFTKTFAL